MFTPHPPTSEKIQIIYHGLNYLIIVVAVVVVAAAAVVVVVVHEVEQLTWQCHALP